MCYFWVLDRSCQAAEKGKADAGARGRLRFAEVIRLPPAANYLVIFDHQAVVPLNNRVNTHAVCNQEQWDAR